MIVTAAVTIAKIVKAVVAVVIEVGSNVERSLLITTKITAAVNVVKIFAVIVDVGLRMRGGF